MWCKGIVYWKKIFNGGEFVFTHNLFQAFLATNNSALY